METIRHEDVSESLLENKKDEENNKDVISKSEPESNNSSEAESAGISSNKLNWDKSGSSRMVSLTKFSNLVFIFSSTFGVLSILLVTSTTVFSSLLKIGPGEYEVGFTET